MRVTGGTLRGRPLAMPDGLAVRPTSDKVRQAIFNMLAHHDFGNFALEGARVIDLFAGTGALGVEALSRGARYALFVDEAAESRALVRRNIEAFSLTGVTKIWRRSATDLGTLSGEAFDLAFLDAPYRTGLTERALASLKAGGWLKPGAVVVAETAADENIPPADDYRLVDRRTYGETALSFFIVS
jgi:16S rRNA (guanine966-N2)-methyltransferase